MVATNSHITQYLYSKLSTCFYSLNSSFLFQTLFWPRGKLPIIFQVYRKFPNASDPCHSFLSGMGFLTFPLCFADLSQLRRAISYSLNLSCSWDFYGFCYLKLPQGKQNYFWRTTVLQKAILCSFLLGFPRNKALPWIDTENSVGWICGLSLTCQKGRGYIPFSMKQQKDVGLAKDYLVS